MCSCKVSFVLVSRSVFFNCLRKLVLIICFVILSNILKFDSLIFFCENWLNSLTLLTCYLLQNLTKNLATQMENWDDTLTL